MISRRHLLVLNLGQLVLPAILFYAWPIVYGTVSVTTIDGRLANDYQWSLIALLLSWGIGSVLSGWIFNRVGTRFGSGVGFALSFIAFLLLGEFYRGNMLILISIIVGFSLSFLFMDPVIARFKEVGYDEKGFNKQVIGLTLVSGFASTFSYLVLAPVYSKFAWLESNVIIIALLLLFFIGYMTALRKSATHSTNVLQEKPNYKSLFSRCALWMTLIFSSQGIIQTLVFFEIFTSLNRPGEHLDYILFSFAIIGVAQVVGRLFIILWKGMSGVSMTLLSSVLMLVGALALFYALYVNIYLMPLFSLFFGAGLGISTIAKPVLINEVFKASFSFFNGFYSGVLNFSRALIPLAIGVGLLASSQLYIVTLLVCFTLVALISSLIIEFS
ncbi:hypothetical protein M9194_14845 [Vibrio sp. S4M6]|uniref:hypothetical protein n=1 Tax=Vibrio sinus TaxID=2946865 RepID=UPI00202A3AB9|nr:hypothetical protein [Vibrio sinus]MCL9782711.1 hypothetical protein [Vibrio sinus]